MRRKRNYLRWTAAGAVLGITAANAGAGPTATLSINAFDGNWTAYLQLDNGTDNVGLATFAIDVIGSNGVTVTSSNLDVGTDVLTIHREVGTQLLTPVNEVVGWSQFASGGIDGMGITAGQNVAYAGNNSFAADLGVETGVSQTPNTDGNDNGRYGTTYTNAGTTYIVGSLSGGPTWGVPTDVASGTYSQSGFNGSLSAVLDTTTGQGIQSLNNNGSGGWMGPGNVTFDTVITSSINTLARPIVSLIPATDVQLPPQQDVAAAGASVVTPSTADSSDQIAYTGSAVLIQVNSPHNNEEFAYTNANNLPSIDVLLKFVDTSTDADPVNPQVLSDIENYITSVEFGDGITMTTTIPASLSSQFPGTTFDLMLSSSIFPFSDDALLDFSEFSDSAVPSGDLAVSDIGLIPEAGEH
jgi:hypothetical protein